MHQKHHFCEAEFRVASRNINYANEFAKLQVKLNSFQLLWWLNIRRSLFNHACLKTGKKPKEISARVSRKICCTKLDFSSSEKPDVTASLSGNEVFDTANEPSGNCNAQLAFKGLANCEFD